MLTNEYHAYIVVGSTYHKPGGAFFAQLTLNACKLKSTEALNSKSGENFQNLS